MTDKIIENNQVEIMGTFCMGPFIQFCREHFTDKMAAGELFGK